jgi:chromate transport protein ChrA
MNISFKTKRDTALTAFGAAVAMVLVFPVYRESLLILISGVCVLLIFLLDKVHKQKTGEHD